MTDATKLFRSGKRYRGFVQTDETTLPVTFTVYPVNAKEVRLKYLFPISMMDRIRKGTVVYILIENEERLIGELRVVETDSESKTITTSLDFVTRDRRKFPRVFVKGILDITVKLSCEEGEIAGEVVDLSMASLGVETGRDLREQECDVELSYRGHRIRVRGKVVRSSEGVVILEFINGNSEVTNFLSRVYSDLFLKTQRGQ